MIILCPEELFPANQSCARYVAWKLSIIDPQRSIFITVSIPASPVPENNVLKTTITKEKDKIENVLDNKT